MKNQWLDNNLNNTATVTSNGIVHKIFFKKVKLKSLTFAMRASKLGSGRKDRFEISFFLHVGHSLFL